MTLSLAVTPVEGRCANTLKLETPVLEVRVQLSFLQMEYGIVKYKSCTQVLVEVIKSSDEGWSNAEITMRKSKTVESFTSPLPKRYGRVDDLDNKIMINHTTSEVAMCAQCRRGRQPQSFGRLTPFCTSDLGPNSAILTHLSDFNSRCTDHFRLQVNR